MLLMFNEESWKKVSNLAPYYQTYFNHIVDKHNKCHLGRLTVISDGGILGVRLGRRDFFLDTEQRTFMIIINAGENRELVEDVKLEGLPSVTKAIERVFNNANNISES